ncbi:MAG: YlbF family regulator [Clostridia bacterium]
MNIYDTVNKLAIEIKQSEEYVNYKMAKQVIALKPELKKQITEFEKERYNLQIMVMQTGKNDEKKLEEMKKTYEELIEEPNAKKFLETEAKFNILMTDINKIIGESIKDVLE